MKLQRRLSYETPEDTHNGTIINAILINETKNGKPRENLRLTIAVDQIPGDPLHDYRVRMDYWGSQNDSLLDDMFRLLGPDVVHLTDMDGEILPEKLTLLEGKRVQFDVTHEKRPGFKVAYRKVQNLQPLKEAA
ncbi:MAG: hypothetical protein ACO1TE_14660 [Prosthecobacter sp.]